ncbi:MAG: phosphate ABC transporter permease PstA [Candidatus Bathyarchaeota archaeon]|nr:phosphate ABC transporter permease PstA [Candidatus Bathyarchaeota archaeon]
MNPVQKEKMILGLMYVAVFLSIIMLPIIILWVTTNGIGELNWTFLTGTPSFSTSESRLATHGVFPQIIGSFYLVAGSTLLGTPVGVLSAIYLTEYAAPNIITKTIRFFTETLAGIPSIVIGLFGMELLVYRLGFQTSLLSGVVSLSLMTLPFVIRASEEAIKVVPNEYREASLAMGASKWQTILKVVIPAALPGILTGVLLGMGRAIGETAVLILTTGGGMSRKVPTRLTSPVGSLPIYIYLIAKETVHQDLLNRGYAASLVLLIIFFSMSVSALLIRNHYLRKLGNE